MASFLRHRSPEVLHRHPKSLSFSIQGEMERGPTAVDFGGKDVERRPTAESWSRRRNRDN
jgi:hypothetical protein